MHSPIDEASWRPLGSIFGFTLGFEDVVLNMLPSVVALFLSPLIISDYFKDAAVHVRNSPLLWLKLTGAASLISVEMACLFFRCMLIGARTDSTFAAASLDVMAALTVGAVFYIEHQRAIRASAYLGLHLAVGIVIGATRSRHYFLQPDMEIIGILAAVAASMRFSLLILEELPKEMALTDAEADEMGREAMSGFWSRTCFLWLHSVILLGFRAILQIGDLGSIGSEFSSRQLYARFQAPWKSATKTSKFALPVACFRMMLWPFLAIFLPRLAVTACTFLQPFLLERSIAIIGDPSTPDSEVDEMIGAVAVVFTGVAVSHAMTDHMACRCVTKLRGALVSHIIAKTHRLPVSDAKKSAAITLMSTDIESIATGLPRCFDLPIGLVEVALGAYCLSRFTGYCCILVVIMAILSWIVSYLLGRRATLAYKQWSNSIESRVAETSAVLSQLQVIKTLGLGPTIVKYVQRLRVDEIKSSRPYRLLGTCLHTWIEFADSMTPIFVIALSLFWNSSSRHLLASEAYPILSILALTIRPLITILHSYSLVQPMIASLSRIDEFLQLEEHKDPRHHSRPHPITEKMTETTHEKQALTTNSEASPNAVEFDNVSMGPQDMDTPILKGLNFGIARGSISAMLGATGSGKSYFLQSVLGESRISSGSLYVDDRNVAYCGQNVWLENGSVKDNVIGPLPFDSRRYNATIRACMLQEDITALPDGDNFKVGSRGLRLSGGQRARVSIARAVYSELSIVVLDDIFSSLDRKTAVAILTRLLGKNGIFRERKATVLLATYLPECLDIADSLILLDGKGKARLEKNTPPGTHREEILQALGSRNSPAPSVVGEEQEESSTTSVKSTPSPDEESEAALLIRQKGDWGLYRLLFDAFGKRQFALWLLLVTGLSFGEIAPSIYLRFWISLAPSNMVYFTGFALLGLFAVAMMAFCYCVLLLRLSPRAAYDLHKKLLNTTLRSTLAFFSTTDAGSILNRYSQDMTSISHTLPKALYSFLYAFIFQVFQIAAIVSGSTYMVAILAPMIAIAYAVQYCYLRTSRQLRYLDLESKTPLYTLFTEVTDGLMYVRAYGWQQHKLERGFERLDASQKPYYLLFSLQRWLGLVLDLLAAAIAVVLATLALKLRDTTSEAAFGLSFYHAIEFSRILTAVIRFWTTLETAVGAISRLRSFLRETPVEPAKGVIPPKNWPRNGRIQIQRVTARYSSEKSDPGVLKCISLTIEPGQKIGLSGRTGR
ncbi:hypothetical protein NLG97_g1156 [Lecanicillium saksenae]|uniref:Uncharacterized protein n=1 Tax=Lecanicillium saksenae TaxID=468837 RepID=A0ACC1R4J7_9HYPO|nr:hypothetical protein NLG97_g1156 [Lecanicillium saksenae]